MATRKGDVEAYRSGISSVLEGAERDEAAFYDPITQAALLGTSVADTYSTAMKVVPATQDFIEGFRKKDPIGEEGLNSYNNIVSDAVGFTQPTLDGSVKPLTPYKPLDISGLKETDMGVDIKGLDVANVKMTEARKSAEIDKHAENMFKNWSPYTLSAFANKINRLTPDSNENVTYVTEDGTKTGAGYVKDFWDTMTTPIYPDSKGGFNFNTDEGEE